MNGECYCDYERPTMFAKSNPIARTRHTCTECYGWIEPRERYEVAVGVWDGAFCTYKTCPDCVALRSYLAAHMPCYCPLFQGLHETARDDLQYIVSAADFPTGMGMEAGRLLVRCKLRSKARKAERAAQGDK